MLELSDYWLECWFWTVVADNFISLDFDKLATEVDSAKKLIVENLAAENFAYVGIQMDYDIVVIAENCFENFVDSLRQLLL